jgi:hypothetical protein
MSPKIAREALASAPQGPRILACGEAHGHEREAARALRLERADEPFDDGD